MKTKMKTKTFRLTLPMPRAAHWRDEIPHPDNADLENERVERLFLTYPEGCWNDAAHVLTLMFRAIALTKLQAHGPWSCASHEEKVEAHRDAYRQLAEALGYVFED